MVLAVMVGFLIFRVYQILYPPEPPGGVNDGLIRPPSRDLPDDVDTPGIPPQVPPQPRSEDWSRLWRSNPLNYRQPRSRGGTTGPQSEEIDVQLIRISPAAAGKYRAQIRTPSRTGWYEEGQAFESYELLAIDPEANTVTVFSEQIQRAVTIQKEN